MNKHERLMLAAWLSYRTEFCQFPSDYLRVFCGTDYEVLRRRLPESIQYLVDIADRIHEHPPTTTY